MIGEFEGKSEIFPRKVTVRSSYISKRYADEILARLDVVLQQSMQSFVLGCKLVKDENRRATATTYK
jgi:hypothetical protein